MKSSSGGVTDYCGNFIYADNQLITIFAGDVRVAPVNVGNSTYWKYEYSMKDHLGNTRVVFAAHSHGQPELLQQTSYYPGACPEQFGSMTMQQQNFYSQNTTENKYLYNSKELQDDQLAGNTLDWYDYGARFYDATLGRWHVVDPLAEQVYDWTPYRYAFNNPIKFIDPDGKIEWPIKGNSAVNKKDTKDGGWNLKNIVVRTSSYLDTDRPPGASNPHIGIDYRASEGTPFYSLGDGKIIATGENRKGVRWSNSTGQYFLQT